MLAVAFPYTVETMAHNSPGSIRLFRLFGIDVMLHWSWFVVAAIMFQYSQMFGHPVWHVLTYLSLFAIVLIHEFGHALACRSVGGQANLIVLWPLGGVAIVRPPARPGAVLWSVAAGPLVNVALVPVTVLAYKFVAGDATNTDFKDMTNLQQFVYAISMINLGILCFNMLPIYPLDGGQILQSLLWFVMGRARSLHVTSIIGMTAAACGVATATYFGRTWLMIMAMFIGWQAWNGYRTARMMLM